MSFEARQKGLFEAKVKIKLEVKTLRHLQKLSTRCIQGGQFNTSL